MTFKTNQIMYWDGYKVSDHNRAPLEETYEIIERKSRTVSGTLRKYIVAKKKNWSTSWDNLPSTNWVEDFGTVDGGMSGEEMQAFYEINGDTPFIMTLKTGTGDILNYNVMLSEFSRTVNKRGAVDWWDVSVTIEEV